MPRKAPSSSQTTAKRAMQKFKRGTLKSGQSKKRVTNRKQAIAIGLSEARKKGAGVAPSRRRPPARATRTSATRRTAAKRSSRVKRT